MRIKIVLIFIFCSLFITCGIFNNSDTTESGLCPIEDTILFHIFENYATTDVREIPKLTLYLKSANVKKLYPCSNYRIEVDIQIDKQDIHVDRETLCEMTGQVQGMRYFVAVTAIDYFGNESAFSRKVIAIPGQGGGSSSSF